MPHIKDLIQQRIPDAITFVPPAPACPVCEDHGRVLSRDNQVMDCPANCGAARQLKERRMANTFKYHSWSQGDLELFNLESFYGMPDKELAVAATDLFAQGNPFTLADCASIFNVKAQYNADHPSNWLTLWGDNGTGKTSLMAAAANLLRAGGKQAIMLRYETLYARIKESYGDDSVSENAIVGNVSRAEYLLIDEISIPTPITPNSASIFGRIIDYRNSKQLPTMFTCNWDEFDLARHWGKLIATRILAGHYIKLEGQILRPRSQSVSSSLRN